MVQHLGEAVISDGGILYMKMVLSSAPLYLHLRRLLTSNLDEHVL